MIVRNILALVAGVAMGVVAVAFFETLGHILFPVPADGVDLSNPDVIAQYMEKVPLPAKLAVLVAWFAGIVVSGLVALYVARGTRWPGLGAMALLFAAVIFNLASIPHPLWMSIAGVVVSALGAAVVLWRGPRNGSDSPYATQPPN